MKIKVTAMLAMAATLSLFSGAQSAPGDIESSDPALNPYRAPILREADLDGDNTTSSRQSRDSGMTGAERIDKLYSATVAGGGKGVDPAAYIAMEFLDKHILVNCAPKKVDPSQQASNGPDIYDTTYERQRLQYNLTLAKAKLNSMFKNSRKPARGVKDFQAIRLGASLQPHETLASNINSYVPDKFNDGEIVHMFELNEALRTGEKSLNAIELTETNSLLLSLYLRALVGLRGPVVVEPASEEGRENCLICFDTLNEEPSFRLLDCGHKFHIDCLMNWIGNDPIQRCTICRQRFRHWFGMTETQ